ncbi:AT-rich interaction domain 6 [Brachyhypopomus gauderio]|uniref:AT-rich interaction domain 6 n=1 Tax=Brachyhypopomus gauderio TaxID=698409 RepID=UPI004042E96A
MMEKDSTTETNGEKMEEMTEEGFLKDLYFFMKQRDTPIERIPHLGFKQIDLFVMYKAVKELGGYHQVTAQQLWKKVYNILGGNPRSTSAATCTRRHYEKLLLAYEYHLAGYGEDIPISPPRKRFRYDDYPMSAKRADYRHVNPFHQFMHPGTELLPGYFSLAPSVPNLSAPVASRPSTAFLPGQSFDSGPVKHPLHFLRYLAEKYKSTSGLVEPLNLSKKCSKMMTTSSTPSSFAPPATKKEPKFLNEAPPLYPTRGVTVDEGVDQPGSVGGSLKGEVPAPAQAVVSPLRVDEPPEISPTSSGRSPTLWKEPPSPTPPPTHRPSHSSALAVSEPEKSLHAPWAKSGSSTPPQPSPTPLSHSPIGPPSDPYSGMEIQIPLSLLQKWIKEGVFFSSAPPPHQTSRHSPSEPTKPRSSPEPISLQKLNCETSYHLSSDHPADLSLKKHPKDPRDPRDPRDPKDPKKYDISMDTPRPFISPVNESRPANIDRYASIKPFRMCVPMKAPLSNELYNRSSHLKAPEAKDQGGRPVHTAGPEGQGYAGSSSPRPSPVSALPGPPWPQKTSGKLTAPSPPLAKVNSSSSSLIQITPEQLKLLMSSSTFRPERRKIC